MSQMGKASYNSTEGVPAAIRFKCCPSGAGSKGGIIEPPIRKIICSPSVVGSKGGITEGVSGAGSKGGIVEGPIRTNVSTVGSKGGIIERDGKNGKKE